MTPPDRTARRVDRRQPAAALLHRVRLVRPAHVVLAWNVDQCLRLLKGAAPLDGRDVEHVRSRTEGRSVPLHAAENTRARVHPFFGHRDLDVVPTRDRDGRDLRATLPVQDTEQSFLADHGDEGSWLAVDVGAEEWAHLRESPIVEVVRRRLVVPREVTRTRGWTQQSAG